MLRISTLAVCFFGAANIVASDDLADRATRTVEAEIRMAIKEAQRLASKNPAKATEKLKSIQQKLESDRILSDERRTQLSRLIADRLRVVAEGPVTALRVPRDAVIAALEADSRAAMGLIEVLASRFREMT